MWALCKAGFFVIIRLARSFFLQNRPCVVNAKIVATTIVASLMSRVSSPCVLLAPSLFTLGHANLCVRLLLRDRNARIRWGQFRGFCRASIYLHKVVYIITIALYTLLINYICLMYVPTSNCKKILQGKKVPIKNFIATICLIKSLIIFRLLYGKLKNMIDISRNFCYLITVVTTRCSNKWPEMRIATVIISRVECSRLVRIAL